MNKKPKQYQNNPIINPQSHPENIVNTQFLCFSPFSENNYEQPQF